MVQQLSVLVISGTAAFLVTHLDALVVMGCLYGLALEGEPARAKHITLGMVIGTFILVAASAAAALLTYDLPDIVIKSLGALPIIFGALALRKIVDNRKLEEEFGVYIERYRHKASILSVALITLAIGGDNVAVYVPLMAGRNMPFVMGSAVLFMVLALPVCWMANLLGKHPLLIASVSKICRLIFPLAMIALGIWIFIR